MKSFRPSVFGDPVTGDWASSEEAKQDRDKRIALYTILIESGREIFPDKEEEAMV